MKSDKKYEQECPYMKNMTMDSMMNPMMSPMMCPMMYMMSQYMMYMMNPYMMGSMMGSGSPYLNPLTDIEE